MLLLTNGLSFYVKSSLGDQSYDWWEHMFTNTLVRCKIQHFSDDINKTVCVMHTITKTQTGMKNKATGGDVSTGTAGSTYYA